MLCILIGLALAMALLSLRGESERRAYIAAELARMADPIDTPVSVIVPVKGMDEGLRENLRALADQDYPDYELIVVARAGADLPQNVVPAGARVVIAGPADPETGEKINNLLAAIGQARPESQVFAFADSDGRPERHWLRALVHALRQPGTGAATGYRWYVAGREFWSIARSAWNAVIAGGFGPGDMRFCWGGATAIRRSIFESARVEDYWRGAISDDYRLSQAIHDAGLRIVFAPGAMVSAAGGTSAGEFLGWIVRQMRITRFYAPRLWAIATGAHLVYCGAMVAALAAGWPVLFLLQWTLGGWKAWRRAVTFQEPKPALHAFLQPVTTWLWLYACVAAGISRTIRWRGNIYRLRQLSKP